MRNLFNKPNVLNIYIIEKMKWNGLLVLMFAITSLIVVSYSCSEESPVEKDIMEIRYGTSNGMCIGYCNRDISFREGSILFHRYGNVDTVETITCYDNLQDSVWHELNAAINIDEFFQLPETIGCPDCADRGAEWIEIFISESNKHKVTFEYNEEPLQVKSFIEFLRQQLSLMEFCDEGTE